MHALSRLRGRVGWFDIPGKGSLQATTHPQTGGVFFGDGAESQNRTGDTAIFSRVLYQLSYLGRGA